MDGLPLTRSTTSGTAAAISRFFALVSRGGIRWPASTLPGRSYHLRSHSYPPHSFVEYTPLPPPFPFPGSPLAKPSPFRADDFWSEVGLD